MPANARNLTTIALTCVMAVLLCLVQTASAVAAKSPEKTASGNFFADPNIYTGEIAPESLQPQWEIDPVATPSASGRQDWLSADPLGEAGGMNLYGYVGGDPVNLWDPDGRDPVSVPNTNYDRHIANRKAIAVGQALRWPGQNFDNQCAAGAQHNAGPSGRDAPSTRVWERGDPVGDSTPFGTMLAKGWIPDPNKARGYKYPSQSNEGNPSVSNHTVIFLRKNPDGTIQVRHQMIDSETGKGFPFHETAIKSGDFHEVWTKKGATCPPGTGKWGNPK